MIWIRVLLFTVLVPGTVLFYVPIAIASSAELRLALGPLGFLGAIPILLGSAAYFSSAWNFAVKGGGTPAPIDPPRALVVAGLYRHVRNPMYVGGVLILLGHVLWFQAPSLLLYAAAVFTAFHLFVVLYEERALERQFGASYREFRASVPRWIPRLRPWRDAGRAAGADSR